ncbi:hypothetical protein WICMUC_001818 [Wickerhamomyces mucosus]|uniref:Protein YIF1 n=1 Tax=Wickerhamomyces mucosus TaxID=1378264 RepID=A0A9P8PRZ6_9ASCO|nr:hypothetical protein WICMUC_001818 [Wickerhamomyces mucosus]
MAYNPYANIGDDNTRQSSRNNPQNSYIRQQQTDGFQQHYQQPQQQNYQPGYSHQQYGNGSLPSQQHSIPQNNQNNFFSPTQNSGFPNIFNDPTAAMGVQLGQSAFLASQQMIDQNFQKYVPTSDIKYYFKVSNTYVLNKILLILIPFRHKNWVRGYRRSETVNPQQNDSNVELYAYPLDDTNAPDLYIPLMSIVTYILTLALISGLKGDFHPEVFGYKFSSTLFYLIVEFVILRGGLYLLNVNVKLWDIISYIGYKFIPIVLILIIKNLSNFRIVNWFVYLYLLISYGYFELRSIRFNLFAGLKNTAQNISNATIRNSNYFLLVYTFALQGSLFWLLS